MNNNELSSFKLWLVTVYCHSWTTHHSKVPALYRIWRWNVTKQALGLYTYLVNEICLYFLFIYFFVNLKTQHEKSSVHVPLFAVNIETLNENKIRVVKKLYWRRHTASYKNLFLPEPLLYKLLLSVYSHVSYVILTFGICVVHVHFDVFWLYNFVIACTKLMSPVRLSKNFSNLN